ncbi:MAG: adenylate/guanylate cyclase domain-containing protein [Treponema sp.]
MGVKNKIVSFIVLILSFYLSSCTKLDVLQSSSNGLYDVSNMDRDTVYSLKGLWGYAEQTFIAPDIPIERYPRFESIGDSWTHYSNPQPAHSYASYAVKIRGLNPEKVYAIHFPRTSSAITAFLNGERFYTSGIPGNNIETETFEWNADTVILPAGDETEVLLVIHLSNFHDRNPGIETAFLFGLYPTLRMKKSLDKLVTSAIFAILLTMATFFISLFFFYRKETAAGLFGLLCLSFAIRTLCYNDFLLKDFFPAISSLAMFRLGYFTFPACALFTFLFIFHLFIKKTPKLLYILISPLILYAAATIVTPMHVFVDILLIVQLYMIGLALIASGIVLHALIHKKPFARLFLISFLLFIGAAIFDVLIANGIINNAVFVSHFAVLLLLIPMAFIVIRHFSGAFKTQEQLIESIEKTNISFQRFFPHEFIHFLSKENVTDIALGDNINKKMFVAFIHLSIKTDLGTSGEREDLLILYNTVIQSVNPLIKKHNGFIDKYLTEGLMVLFYGTAEETVNCLIDIIMVIRRINIHRENMHLPGIRISAGVHYGKLMMGTIGEEERMDTTVISDAVNIASRMHSYATEKKVHLLISEPVRSQLSETYWRTHSCFYHGKIQFYGRKNLTNVYEVNLL